MFLTAEFLTLCLFFCVFAVMRSNNLDAFEESQSQLDIHGAFVNTLVLMTSGMFAALSVHLVRASRAKTASVTLSAAIILGILFVALKTNEYIDKYSMGYTLGSSDFFFFYYFLTGFHYLHVLLGIVFLSYVLFKTMRGNIDAALIRNTESSAAFWHMLDLVWIIIFPLLYLL